MNAPANQGQPSKSAMIMYKPIGLSSGIVAGMITTQIFNKLWKASPISTDEPPAPLEKNAQLRELLVATALQGALFALVRTGVQRAGARGFMKATGEWPGPR